MTEVHGPWDTRFQPVDLIASGVNFGPCKGRFDEGCYAWRTHHFQSSVSQASQILRWSQEALSPNSEDTSIEKQGPAWRRGVPYPWLAALLLAALLLSIFAAVCTPGAVVHLVKPPVRFPLIFPQDLSNRLQL